jgi:hypothetical protein
VVENVLVFLFFFGSNLSWNHRVVLLHSCTCVLWNNLAGNKFNFGVISSLTDFHMLPQSIEESHVLIRESREGSHYVEDVANIVMLLDVICACLKLETMQHLIRRESACVHMCIVWQLSWEHRKKRASDPNSCPSSQDWRAPSKGWFTWSVTDIIMVKCPICSLFDWGYPFSQPTLKESGSLYLTLNTISCLFTHF